MLKSRTSVPHRHDRSGPTPHQNRCNLVQSSANRCNAVGQVQPHDKRSAPVGVKSGELRAVSGACESAFFNMGHVNAYTVEWLINGVESVLIRFRHDFMFQLAPADEELRCEVQIQSPPYFVPQLNAGTTSCGMARACRSGMISSVASTLSHARADTVSIKPTGINARS